MLKSQKRTILATGIVLAAAALVTMVAYPAYAAGQDYRYALNEENWGATEQPASTLDVSLSSTLVVQIDAKGYAFARVDQENLKQYSCTTNIVIQVQPATETTEREIDITGTVKVNDAAYTVSDGKVLIGKEKKLIYVDCTGTDDNGNQITLKFGANYFWWGGHAYALRSKAALHTDDQSILLLQRGIAKINP